MTQATYDEGYGDLGTEDLGGVDSIPRVKINHREGVFEASDGTKMAELPAIILGAVLQRVFFKKEVLDSSAKASPHCKSPDGQNGYPNENEKTPVEFKFPWDRSNFDPATAPVSPEGLHVLSCDACIFSKWTDNANGPNTPPPCAEQLTLPLIYPSLSADGTKFTEWDNIATISFQKSQMKATMAFAKSFRAQRKPMFSVYTTIRLESHQRGNVVYYTPVFVRGNGVSEELWPTYADTYREFRAALHTPPRAFSGNEIAAAPQQAAIAPAPVQAQPVQQAAPDPWGTQAAPPAASDPFATTADATPSQPVAPPTPAPQPVQAPPAAPAPVQAPPVQAVPTPAPTTPPTPTAQTTPQAPIVVDATPPFSAPPLPTPPADPQPAWSPPAPAAGIGNDDPLPF